MLSNILFKFSSIPSPVYEEFEIFYIWKIVRQTYSIYTGHIPNDLTDEIGTVQSFWRVYILSKPARSNFKG